MKSINIDYLLSLHYLKKLVEAKLISYEQYEEIDRLNRARFLKGKVV